MEYKDYYKILGVDRKATAAEIRRAYRKLAQKYHPDHNPDDPKAEEKFKEINEANQVLSDPKNRARYDQLGESYTQWQQRGAPAGGFNWDDWYAQRPSGGTRVEYTNLDDLFGSDFSDFFRSIFGGMGGNVDDLRTTQSRRTGQRTARPPVEQPLTITLLEAFQGTMRRLEVNGKHLEVKIPAGAHTGTKVRIPKAVVHPNGQTDDLYLVIQVSEDARFERKENDLYTNVPVSLFTAVLGGEVTVPTLAGNVVLTIPAGTQPDQLFRLAGKGMPLIKDPRSCGDLLARVKIQIPKKLSSRQKELFRQLASSE